MYYYRVNGIETQKFDGSFNDYISVEVISKDKLDEVLYRATNYLT